MAPFLDPTDRGGGGNVGIIRSPLRATTLPDNHGAARPDASHSERSEKSVVSDISPINASHHSVAVRHAHAQSAPINQKVFVDRPITIPPGAKLALSAEAGAPEGMEDS